MDNNIMSTNESIDATRRDERCRQKHVIRYKRTAQERKRLRQQQIKEDLRGLRTPSIVCLIFGILFTLGSIGMTACGYYADDLATQDRGNSTVVDEELKEHLEDLKRIGPVLIGCGIFTTMCALVIVFETNGDKGNSNVSKRSNDQNSPCYMEYNFGGTEEQNNTGEGLKQLATLDVDNLPQTAMQYLNDTNVEPETRILLSNEQIGESSHLQISDETNRELNNSNNNILNSNNENDADQAATINPKDQIEMADHYSLLNCTAKPQLPPLDLSTARKESRGLDQRVKRGSNKTKQKRTPTQDNKCSSDVSLQKETTDDPVKNETENDTFKLIDANDEVVVKKGKRRSLRGSLKRKRRLANAVQPSDNAAFDMSKVDDDEIKAETYRTSRSQPSSSTFSRKFSNEAWSDGSNNLDNIAKTALIGTFRSESNLVLPNKTHICTMNDSINPNSQNTTSRQIETKETELVPEIK